MVLLFPWQQKRYNFHIYLRKIITIIIKYSFCLFGLVLSVYCFGFCFVAFLLRKNKKKTPPTQKYQLTSPSLPCSTTHSLVSFSVEPLHSHKCIHCLWLKMFLVKTSISAVKQKAAFVWKSASFWAKYFTVIDTH